LLSGDDLKVVCDAFQISWDPIEFDAQYVSPTRRRRHFFTNIPLESSCDYAFEDQHVESCLAPGFVLPSQIVEPGIPAKANCLMASTTRIDERTSLRMYVFDKKYANSAQSYHGRPMTVLERENLMGFPEGYVTEPMKDLFEKLTDVNRPHKSASWRENLDKRYLTFGGNFHKFPNHQPYIFSLIQIPKGEYQIKMRMAPPIESNKIPSFYNEEEYGKHLIGNSYSVPVVEALLRALTYYFPANYDYEDCNYKYSWENSGAVNVKQEEE